MLTRASNLRTAAVLTSALALALGTAVHAEGKKDRAQEAIAAADAKIQAAQTAGAGSATPDKIAHAREILADAREELRTGHKEAAIADANHAGALAEGSIGQTQQQVVASAANAVGQARSEAADARDQAASQVAEANERAASADRAAAASAQQAQAAQASAAVAEEAATAASASAQPAPQVQTTVTTEDQTSSAAAPAKVTHRRVVHHHRSRATHVHKTTTTVTQTQ